MVGAPGHHPIGLNAVGPSVLEPDLHLRPQDPGVVPAHDVGGVAHGGGDLLDAASRPKQQRPERPAQRARRHAVGGDRKQRLLPLALRGSFGRCHVRRDDRRARSMGKGARASALRALGSAPERGRAQRVELGVDRPEPSPRVGQSDARLALAMFRRACRAVLVGSGACSSACRSR